MMAEQFLAQWERLGGKGARAATYQEACDYLAGVIESRTAKSVCGWDDPVLAEAGVAAAVAGTGARYLTPAGGLTREACASCTIGVTTADLIAVETGTLAMAFRPGRPRSVGLLPPTWVAIVPVERLRAGRPDLVQWIAAQTRSGNPPAQLGLISGPSRTSDIESILLTGVHGPGDVHAVVVG